MTQREQRNYLGRNLKLLAAAHNMSYKDIAERTAIDQSYISRIANSDPSDLTKRTSIGHILKIADLFKIDLEKLIREDLPSKFLIEEVGNE